MKLKEYRLKNPSPPKDKNKVIIAVIDFETDPFKHGDIPKPFCCDFYSGDEHVIFWGDECASALVEHILSLKTKHIIYAHNGGKFDFYFLLEIGAVENPMLIIGGRIVKAKIGIHEIRDSFSIFPLPLSKMGDKSVGDKLVFDYSKMLKTKRNKHKTEIIEYLKQDCVVLLNAVVKFIDRYGDKITVGSMAISELNKLHNVRKQNQSHDQTFRPFYFGGRVECFQRGHIQGPLKIYDVNSMYPAVMRNFQHPKGGYYISITENINKRFNFKTGLMDSSFKVYFMKFRAYSNKCLPIRDKKGQLFFPVGEFDFMACSHEIITGLKLGLLIIKKIYSISIPIETQNFKEFVDIGSEEKINAQLLNDFMGVILSKLKLNAAYGRFAIDPEKFKEYFLLDTHADISKIAEFEKWKNKEMEGDGVCELISDYGRFEIWQRPVFNERGYHDVAIAASITSAARSILMEAIHHSKNPVYCDTDSLVCSDIGDEVQIDSTRLGAWKFEGQTEMIHVAGKKLYAYVDDKGKTKVASKGAVLSIKDIIDIVDDKTITWASDAPNFKLSGNHQFISRRIQKRVDNFGEF